MMLADVIIFSPIADGGDNMSDEKNNSGENSEESEKFDKEQLMDFLSDFMRDGRHAERMFRENMCDLVVQKVFDDFGYEGLCTLLLKIDYRAQWISDILIENSDFDDVLFKKYGTYDSEICEKARNTEAMMEMNGKIWRLRKRYATLIVDEVMSGGKK